MKLIRINKIIKCDTVLCHKNAIFKICTNSYKGDIFLCENCFKTLQSILKRTIIKNEQKEK